MHAVVGGRWPWIRRQSYYYYYPPPHRSLSAVAIRPRLSKRCAVCVTWCVGDRIGLCNLYYSTLVPLPVCHWQSAFSPATKPFYFTVADALAILRDYRSHSQTNSEPKNHCIQFLIWGETPPPHLLAPFTSLFSPSISSQLTIYTCTSFIHQKW